ASRLRLGGGGGERAAARAPHRQDTRGILARAAGAAGFSDLDRIRYRRDKSFIARLCVRAVDRLFEGSGARAVMDSEPIQRCHRDAHSASHHAPLSWDLVAEQFGRQSMGGPYGAPACSQGSREGGGAPFSYRRNGMKVVDAIAEIMKREGVEFLSTYPTTPVIDAAAAAGIRPVLCRQERVGVGIADGFSRTTNGRRL